MEDSYFINKIQGIHRRKIGNKKDYKTILQENRNLKMELEVYKFKFKKLKAILVERGVS